MRRRTAVALALAATAAAVWPDVASAHGLVGRADLPIPSWLFGWGASIVLIVSFVALATLWPQPRLEQAVERPWFRIPAWVDPICGLIGVALLGVVVYSGLEGTSEAMNNFAWLELVYTQKTPQTLAWLCIGYAVVQLLAMAAFGIERWVDNGDGFTVYFNLFSRLSPLIRRDGVLHLRPPLAGVPSMPM